MTQKQKMVIQFRVEMTEDEAWALAHMLDKVRHNLNEKKKWDISKDMPNYSVRPLADSEQIPIAPWCSIKRNPNYCDRAIRSSYGEGVRIICPDDCPDIIGPKQVE